MEGLDAIALSPDEINIDEFTIYISNGSEVETRQVSIDISQISKFNGDGDTSFNDTIIATTEVSKDDSNYLNNVTLDYFSNGVDTGVSTLVEGGAISFDQSIVFDAVKLADASAFSTSIQADDAVAILRDIVALDSLDGNATVWNTADVNNNGAIQADDAVAILRHIVELDTIDTFDLIDINGNKITTLDPDAAEGQWIMVATGDVSQSGSFNDDYTVAIDIV
jgi:hypothetical protein